MALDEPLMLLPLRYGSARLGPGPPTQLHNSGLTGAYKSGGLSGDNLYTLGEQGGSPPIKNGEGDFFENWKKEISEFDHWLQPKCCSIQ